MLISVALLEMVMVRFLVLAFCAFTFIMPHQATAKRVALIISNSNYEYMDSLSNPERDGELIKKAFRNFDEVVLRDDLRFDSLESEDVHQTNSSTNINLEQSNFHAALEQFAILSKNADVAVIYFAGHGMQGVRENWLLPTNANIQSEDDLWDGNAISTNELLRTIAGARTQILLLDACRITHEESGNSDGNTEIPQGLMEFTAKPYGDANLLVMYSAWPREVAYDGPKGGNSPFALTLATQLENEELHLLDLSNAIQNGVRSMTDDMVRGPQTPFFTPALRTKIYLASSYNTVHLPNRDRSNGSAASVTANAQID